MPIFGAKIRISIKIEIRSCRRWRALYTFYIIHMRYNTYGRVWSHGGISPKVSPKTFVSYVCKVAALKAWPKLGSNLWSKLGLKLGSKLGSKKSAARMHGIFRAYILYNVERGLFGLLGSGIKIYTIPKMCRSEWSCADCGKMSKMWIKCRKMWITFLPQRVAERKKVEKIDKKTDKHRKRHKKVWIFMKNFPKPLDTVEIICYNTHKYLGLRVKAPKVYPTIA